MESFFKCKREKSSTLITALQLLLIALYFLSLALVVTAAGLFGNAHYRLEDKWEETGYYTCVLYFSESNLQPSESICQFCIWGEAAVGFGLVILMIVGFIKIAFGLIK